MLHFEITLMRRAHDGSAQTAKFDFETKGDREPTEEETIMLRGLLLDMELQANSGNQTFTGSHPIRVWVNEVEEATE